MAVELEEFLGVPGEPVLAVERSSAGPAAFWNRFEGAARWLTVEHQHDPDGIVPITELRGSRAHGAIRYLGSIDGRQLAPLAEALRALATGQVDADTPATAAILTELPTAMALQIVVSPSCPFCPSVTAAVLRFACLSIRLAVTVLRSDQAAIPPGVGGVPTVLADGRIVATGAVGEYELAEKLAHAAR